MFLKRFFLITSLICFSLNSLANEKDQIVVKLNSLNSLEFTFDQIINEKMEKGSCLLQFPGKLRCEYFDDKQKFELYGCKIGVGLDPVFLFALKVGLSGWYLKSFSLLVFHFLHANAPFLSALTSE